MKQRKTLSYLVFTVVLFAALILTSLIFAACGGPKYKITWEYENATITVDGHTSLPTEASEDSTLLFTVTPANGYVLESVDQDGVAISKTGDKYSLRVTADTKIVVKTTKEISSVTVSANPTKLFYVHGEPLDKTGMEVKVNYTLGGSTTVDGSDSGVKVTPSTFIAGDKSFTVTYNNKTSAAVQLSSTVEYLVTLDPNGAQLSAAAIDRYKNQNNYKYNATTGILSFTYYNNIPEGGIALPTTDDLTLEDYTFYGWRDSNTTEYKELNKDQDMKNLTLKATWEAQLVKVNKVFFEKRTVGGESVAYLVLDGEFMAATSANLYLFEGNDDIELEGPQVTGSRGEPFELLFNLADLAAARTDADGTYEGKWMDIRFKASIGAIEGQQEVYVDEVEVNLGDIVLNNGFAYGFETFASQSNGETVLKVYYTVSHVEYSMEYKTVEDAPMLVLNGKVYNEDYYGKTVMISWWQDGETDGDFGVIAADGTWTINIDLTQFKFETIAYAHVGIVQSADDTSPIWGGTSQNLIRSNCTTPFTEIPQGDRVGGIAVALKSGDDNYLIDEIGNRYHVGCMGTGSASGIVFYAQQGAFTSTSVSLKTSDSKAIIEIKGTYGVDDAEMAELVLDFQNTDGWGYTYFPIGDKATLVASGGVFTYTAEITSLGAGTNLIHFGFGQDSGKNLFIGTSSGSITVGGRTYTIVPNYNDWSVTAIAIA